MLPLVYLFEPYITYLLIVHRRYIMLMATFPSGAVNYERVETAADGSNGPQLRHGFPSVWGASSHAYYGSSTGAQWDGGRHGGRRPGAQPGARGGGGRRGPVGPGGGAPLHVAVVPATPTPHTQPLPLLAAHHTGKYHSALHLFINKIL